MEILNCVENAQKAETRRKRGGRKKNMVETVCRLAVWFGLVLLGLLFLGFLVSFGGTLHIDFVPYVDICLGSGC